jgi:hypothetical protein
MCDEYVRQLGSVSAPAQVLNAVPETFFSALRNSAEAQAWIRQPARFPSASWREKASLSPFQRSLCSLPPLLGLRPATKGAIPLGAPAALLRKPATSLRLLIFPGFGAVAGETRMRRERARFLDRREIRANDESSPFSALGENGRGFDATAPNPPLSRRRTSSSKPFASVNKKGSGFPRRASREG